MVFWVNNQEILVDRLIFPYQVIVLVLHLKISYVYIYKSLFHYSGLC
jgi:hypothetical protein